MSKMNMRLKISLMASILFAFTSSKAQTEVVRDASFMQSYCACNYDRIDGYFDKGKTPARKTLASTVVYAFPNLEAKVIDTLASFSNIIYIEEGTDTLTKTSWIKVNYKLQDEQGIYREKQGYIIAQSFSIGAVSGNTETENLDFIMGESPLVDADLKQPLFRLNAVNRFTDLSYEKVKNVITYDLDIGPISYYNHFYLASVNNHALAKMPNLLKLYWHHGESCPESEGNVFIAYANGKMLKIISTSSTGDGGFYESTKVYIPVKFDKGKILLVENGDSANMFNIWDATLKTIPYPANSGIPIEQLIVMIEEDGEPKTDANNDVIKDKEGNAVMLITHKVMKYYQWNGLQLKEVKKIVIKQIKNN